MARIYYHNDTVNNISYKPVYIEGSAALDLKIRVPVVLEKGESKLIPTGIKLNLTGDTYAEIFIRSSIALKYGVFLKNSVAIIDQRYKEEIYLNLYNVSKTKCSFNAGDRVAQIIFKNHCKYMDDIKMSCATDVDDDIVVSSDDFDDDLGKIFGNGFGSTGTN